MLPYITSSHQPRKKSSSRVRLLGFVVLNPMRRIEADEPGVVAAPRCARRVRGGRTGLDRPDQPSARADTRMAATPFFVGAARRAHLDHAGQRLGVDHAALVEIGFRDSVRPLRSRGERRPAQRNPPAHQQLRQPRNPEDLNVPALAALFGDAPHSIDPHRRMRRAEGGKPFDARGMMGSEPPANGWQPPQLATDDSEPAMVAASARPMTSLASTSRS